MEIAKTEIRFCPNSTQKEGWRKIQRLFVAEATYFITAVTHARQPLFAHPPHCALLRQTMHTAQTNHPFTMKGYAILPDHLHLLITLAPNTLISKLLHAIKRNFTLNVKKAQARTTPTRLWQRSYWDHVIRDERDFLNHLHYIHYNPVKHGLVSRPLDYPHTSFHEYLKRGWYTPDWGEIEPEEIKPHDWEYLP